MTPRGCDLEDDLRGIGHRLDDVWRDLDLTAAEARDRGERQTSSNIDRAKDALHDITRDVGDTANRAAGLREPDTWEDES